MERLQPIKAIPAGNQAIIVYDGPLNIDSIEKAGIKTTMVDGIPCLAVGENIAIPVQILDTKAGQSTLSLAGGVTGGLVASEFYELEIDQLLLMKIEVWLEMIQEKQTVTTHA